MGVVGIFHLAGDLEFAIESGAADAEIGKLIDETERRLSVVCAAIHTLND